MKTDRLVTFLYILLRNELAAGVVEKIVVEHVEKTRDLEVLYSNPHIEAYARELADRLVSKDDN